MEKRYRSKIDWWLGVIIGLGIVSVVISNIAILIHPPKDGPPAAWLALAMFAMLAFIVWILVSVRYTITDTHLLVRAALFRWRIPLDQILEVFPTHNPLSSPALSLDRLRINFARPNGKKRWLMISPRDREQFLEQLAAAAHLDRDGNWLFRK